MNGASNSSVETVNAAAAAIATTESRILQITAAQRARRKSWFSSYWCFGSIKNTKRIGHAVLTSDQSSSSHQAASTSVQQQTNNINNQNRNAVPPSSPASFLQSESATPLSHSPCSGPKFDLPAFTVGPYAHETQLVTPPVFSALTTEPSTAPLTPPPESSSSIFPTTPPSPEVPFARLLPPYSTHSSSAEGTLNGTPVRRHNLPPLIPLKNNSNLIEDHRISQVEFNHRVSFELTAEDVVRCLERRSTSDLGRVDESVPIGVLVPVPVDESYHDLPERVRHSVSSISSNKEFKFESSTDVEAEGPRRSWSFFPMVQQH
ncbi:hypothetical protein LUZ60_006918 [Juncus effusus]|nr:hypothetical protein LUZ60_006918 [Juncus effusus]